MRWFELHPKVKAAVLAYIVIAAGGVASWAAGEITSGALLGLLGGGLVTVGTAYLKSGGESPTASDG